MTKSFTLLLLTVLLVPYVCGIMFEVQPTVQRCIMEEMRKDVLVSGTFEISDKLSSASGDNSIMRSFQMDFKVHTHRLRTCAEVYAHPKCMFFVCL